jgi:hypothetical protein
MIAAAWLALLAAGCSTIEYYPYSFNREAGQTVKKVAIAPFNLMNPAPSYVGNRSEAVSTAMVSYLNAHGMTVKQGDMIAGIWKEEKEKIGGIYSSRDGRVDGKKFTLAMGKTVSRSCEALSIDAVVFPEVVGRMAKLAGVLVYWDGEQQHILNDSSTFTNFTGSTMALSLSVMIIDKNNRIVLKNVAGIEHPYRYINDGGTPKWELRNDLLVDKAGIDRAIAVSLHPLIPFSGYPEHPSFSKN